MSTRRIVLATTNPGKIAELRRLLPPCIEVVSAGELGLSLPPETGETFAENALIKARAA
ncbi:MAG: non-canonical purine NTP pyrophosphatase, partial [Thermomicrobium sp.]|nr:non-canonical purine NTP pyrophosphatase [Thermomicrobium sp.]